MADFQTEFNAKLFRYGSSRVNLLEALRLYMVAAVLIVGIVFANQGHFTFEMQTLSELLSFGDDVPIFELDCMNVSNTDSLPLFLRNRSLYRFKEGIQYATAKHLDVNRCVMCFREAGGLQCLINPVVVRRGKEEMRTIPMPATCLSQAVNVTLSARIETTYTTVTSEGILGPRKEKAATGGLATTIQIMDALLHGMIKCDKWAPIDRAAWIAPTTTPPVGLT